MSKRNIVKFCANLDVKTYNVKFCENLDVETCT